MSNKKGLQCVTINDYTTFNQTKIEKLNVFYQVFGNENKLQENGVLVCHALTGDSNVAGENGWWKDFVGEGKTIDTTKHPVIAFNIPGNGYDGEEDNLIVNYQDFNVRDIAAIFLIALKNIGITKLSTVIGGSLGGGIAWELIVQEPIFFKKAIIIGTHYQSTDWVIGHNYIQLEILKNSYKPLEIARMMAMMFYRTPESFELKFNRQKVDEKTFQIESYLNYQGNKLTKRFKIEAYRLMTHLLSEIDILEGRFKEVEEVVKNIKSKVILVGIENDYLFQKEYNINSILLLKKAGIDVQYRELKSIHGHDAFLIEIDRMNELLKDLFLA